MTEYCPGLQTQMEARLDLPTLEQVRAFHFRWARMDAQVCTVDIMLGMITDALVVDLHPLPIVYDLTRLAALPGGLDVEWGNEPDGDILPSTYRTALDAACALAASLALRLWAPAISNLDRDSLRWLEFVRGTGWPAGLHGISVHRYGDGTFEWAHDGFASREAEVARLLELCDGLPFIVTEFGYPTPVAIAASSTIRKGGKRTRPKRTRYLRADLHLTEDQQAENITKEWDFWRRYTKVPILYQINDGIHADEGYGIRRCLPDGTLTDWKPSAYTVPKEEPMPDLAPILANTVFAKADLVEVAGSSGHYGLRCPPGADTILSPKTSGAHELRALSYLGGADETCRIAGGLVYFPNVNGQRFAWPLVDDE